MKRAWAAAAALFVLVLVVYAPVVDHEFVNYDDRWYVSENSYVQDGWSGRAVRWAFTTTHTSNRHPLTWL